MVERKSAQRRAYEFAWARVCETMQIVRVTEFTCNACGMSWTRGEGEAKVGEPIKCPIGCNAAAVDALAAMYARDAADELERQPT